VADDFPQGTVHSAADDVRATLSAPDLLSLWSNLTALGRNEFLCWIEDAKQAKTRVKRITRMAEELREGARRPCCWPGCIHRTDKAPGKWQQAVLVEKQRR
jgi:hypothetical protein